MFGQSLVDRADTIAVGIARASQDQSGGGGMPGSKGRGRTRLSSPRRSSLNKGLRLRLTFSYEIQNFGPYARKLLDSKNIDEINLGTFTKQKIDDVSTHLLLICVSAWLTDALGIFYFYFCTAVTILFNV